MSFDRDLISSAQALDLAVEKAIEDPALLTFEEECRRLATALSPVTSSLSGDDIKKIIIYTLALRVMKGKSLLMASRGGSFAGAEDDFESAGPDGVSPAAMAAARRLARHIPSDRFLAAHRQPRLPVRLKAWIYVRRFLRSLRIDRA